MRYSNNTATLAGAAQGQLCDLLDNGYMERRVHLVHNGVGLAECRIVEDSGFMRIRHQSTLKP